MMEWLNNPDQQTSSIINCKRVTFSLNEQCLSWVMTRSLSPDRRTAGEIPWLHTTVQKWLHLPPGTEMQPCNAWIVRAITFKDTENYPSNMCKMQMSMSLGRCTYAINVQFWKVLQHFCNQFNLNMWSSTAEKIKHYSCPYPYYFPSKEMIRKSLELNKYSIPVK